GRSADRAERGGLAIRRQTARGLHFRRRRSPDVPEPRRSPAPQELAENTTKLPSTRQRQEPHEHEMGGPVDEHRESNDDHRQVDLWREPALRFATGPEEPVDVLRRVRQLVAAEKQDRYENGLDESRPSEVAV